MERTDRLDALLDRRDLAAVWFARPASFAWLTGGTNRVDADSAVGVAAAGYDGDVRVVTDDIEADRLIDEELPSDVAVEAYPWYADTLAGAVAEASPRPAAADFAVPGFEGVDPTSLRQPLTRGDVDRYRSLGRDAAAALEGACEAARPDDTERRVAADVRESLSEAGVRAPVVLVGGERRAERYRHFTPTEATVDGYALVSVTAERDGLYASLTRTVAFDPPSWLADRYEAAAAVETAALHATAAESERGGTAAEVFGAIQAAYAAVGRQGEWRNHHQGGAAGFAGREWIATPDADDPVVRPMAYAWNPTVPGAKSENTWLVAQGGIEPLTVGSWGRRAFEPPGGGEALEHPASFLDRGDP